MKGITMSDRSPLSFEAFLQRHAHGSMDGVTLAHCFSGDTEFVTDQGTKTLKECVGQEVNVLTAQSGSDRGFWFPATIRSFGEQRLYRVEMRRNKQTKVIFATSDHRWIVRRPERTVLTKNLLPGQRLAQVRAKRFEGGMSHNAIRRGFHFGDGSVSRHDNKTYGTVALWGEKTALAPYFDEIAQTPGGVPVITPNGVPGVRYSSGMRGYDKVIPELSAPLDYLYGWLAGYFAADGSISKAGQAKISSAQEETLLRVRDIATLLGIGTYEPTFAMRTGYGDQPTPIWSMGLASNDLGEDFFLRPDQGGRFSPKSYDRFGWTISSVEETDRVEEVFCPVVHGTECFALSGGILTGNCAFCGSGAIIARSDGTTECEMCGMCFSVQVQPRYPAFPQTINGQPVPIPGMPDQGPSQAGQLPPGQDPNAMPGQDPEQDPEQDDTDDQDQDSGNPFA